MDLFFDSLGDEITYRAKNKSDELHDQGSIDADRKKEIETFIETRFKLKTSMDIVCSRLNEMIEKFPELYVELTTINISKYK